MKRTAIASGLLSLALVTPAAFSAELNCIGSYHIRLGGKELDTTNYRFRNFNHNRTLTVTNITIYGVDGGILFNLSGKGFPRDFNAVLSPHQTTGLNLEDLFGTTPPPGAFLQTVVTWEADQGRGPLEPLHVTAGRITRGGLGGDGETRARAIVDCRPGR